MKTTKGKSLRGMIYEISCAISKKQKKFAGGGYLEFNEATK